MSPVAQSKPVAQSVPPKSSRMTLSAVVKGKIQQPMRILLFGVEGVGKSTFAAGAPAPIFIGAEDGTAQLDVERFPAPESWTDVVDAVRALTNDSHEYKTLVLDTLDWAEPLLHEFICKRDGKADLESYGFGKGVTAAVDEWRVFQKSLERIQKQRGMHIVLLAHSVVKTYKNPLGPDFDRYEMSMNAKAAGIFKQWVDALLFANHETVAMEDKRKRVRGVDTGMRLMNTEYSAAFDAKNRYSLPPTLPLDWAEFEAAAKAHQPADPAILTSEIERKSKELGGESGAEVLAAMKRAKGDAEKLAFLNNLANTRLAAKAEKESAE